MAGQQRHHRDFRPLQAGGLRKAEAHSQLAAMHEARQAEREARKAAKEGQKQRAKPQKCDQVLCKPLANALSCQPWVSVVIQGELARSDGVTNLQPTSTYWDWRRTLEGRTRQLSQRAALAAHYCSAVLEPPSSTQVTYTAP